MQMRIKLEKDKAPFKAPIQIYTEGAVVNNRFGGGSIEQEAIEAFTAKKKLEAQRQELKSFLNFHYGANSWNQILAMEAEIRKKRKEEGKQEENAVINDKKYIILSYYGKNICI